MTTNAVRAGVAAALGLGLFYALVVGGVGGLAHLGQQATDDWPWLVLILAGFSTQVALFVELRHRHRLHDAAMKTAAGGRRMTARQPGDHRSGGRRASGGPDGGVQ